MLVIDTREFAANVTTILTTLTIRVKQRRTHLLKKSGLNAYNNPKNTDCLEFIARYCCDTKKDMTKRVFFRRRLLRAVEAFLAGNAEAIARGRRIIKQCYSVLHSEAKEFTLDWLIWNDLIIPLTDSVYFTAQDYLLEVRSLLLGLPVSDREKRFIREDFRPWLNADEREWYAQLCNLVDFITAIPFATMEQAVAEDKQQQIPWSTIFERVSEAARAREMEEEYERRCAGVKDVSSRITQPEDIGDEKIFHLVLREVTAIVTAMSIRDSALLYGHPSPAPPYSGGLGSDMSESIAWAKRALEALAGEGTLFFSWRLVEAPTFDADLLIISLH